MTPLEIMAKAKWEAQVKRNFGVDAPGTFGAWEQIGPTIQAGQMNDMRAALLALAEAELSKEQITIGLGDDRYAECFERDFLLMLRAIAEPNQHTPLQD